MTVARPAAAPARPRPNLRRVDLLVAVALCGVGASQALTGWHDGGIGELPSGQVAARLLLAMVLTLPIAWRRSHPVAVVVLIAAGIVVQVWWVVPYVPFLAGLVPLLVATYSTAAYADRRRVVGLLAPAAAIALVMARVPEERLTGEVLFSAFVILGTWLAGDAVHGRVGRARAEVATAQRRLAEQEERLTRARAEERSLIARELHDVIAHSVSVMGVQAGAARTLLRSDPDAAAAALLAVEETARTSVAELQRMLRLLRTAPGTPPRTRLAAAGAVEPERAPQPGVDDLPDLLERICAAGLQVDFESTLTCRPSAGLGLAVFRIVQEALTNALRHGDGAATVRVVASPGTVEVEVRNPRSAARDGKPVSPGHGLVGMRERAALYGGELVAGPDGPSSFVVRARLVEVAPDEGPR